ncbi:MAG: universal stress protein [Acidobacteria bacterium]|nr:universal stress protein [Acidobacteriota bacterium]
MAKMSRIVVGTDGSSAAMAAVAWAAGEAAVHGASLEVVHSWSIPAIADPVSMMPIQLPLDVMEREAHTVCDAAVAAAGAAGAVSVTGTVHRGSAAEHLVAASKSADLVVVGSRGRGGFVGLLLGSVAQQVASHAACPVVVVPSR